MARHVPTTSEQPDVVSEDAKRREAGDRVHDVAHRHFGGVRHRLGSAVERPRAAHCDAEHEGERNSRREDDDELDADNEESPESGRHRSFHRSGGTCWETYFFVAIASAGPHGRAWFLRSSPSVTECREPGLPSGQFPGEFAQSARTEADAVPEEGIRDLSRAARQSLD